MIKLNERLNLISAQYSQTLGRVINFIISRFNSIYFCYCPWMVRLSLNQWFISSLLTESLLGRKQPTRWLCTPRNPTSTILFIVVHQIDDENEPTVEHHYHLMLCNRFRNTMDQITAPKLPTTQI